MKKLIATILLLSLVLAGCTAPNSVPTVSGVPDLNQSTPSESTPSQTDPTDSMEVENSGPVTSDPAGTTSSVPDSTEISTDETEPAGPTEGAIPTEPTPTLPQASENPTTPPSLPDETTPSVPTEPVTTQPTPTEPTPTTPAPMEPKPTQPTVTEPPETEPPATEPAEVIDLDALVQYGLQYAADTYGYRIYPGTRAGYYPAYTCVFSTMAEGKADIRGCVDDTTRALLAVPGFQIVAEIDGVICRARIDIVIVKQGDNNYLVNVYYG